MARLVKAKTKDLGGFEVTRILPSAEQRMVGPFIFLDHMGPAKFPAGQGINVRPHPHIGLATLSYLFEGAMLHRDSLGNCIEIRPGDVNWMTAGKGIVHSERETLEVHCQPHNMNGLQSWLALPKEQTEIDPAFLHVTKENLPHKMLPGTLMRLIAGEAFGMKAPVTTYSPTLYLDIVLDANTDLAHPNPVFETAIYVQWGELNIGETVLRAHEFAVLDPKDTKVTASQNTRFIWLGGQSFEETPLIEWNFVAYTKERMQQAKQDWREGRFPKIPGDSEEFIPY